MSFMHQGSNARNRQFFLGSVFSLSRTFAALMASAVLFGVALPRAAEPQRYGGVIAPEFSSGAPHVTQARLPKAPAQVEMPPPPPMKIVPGMEEVLVATGPVTDQESRDLDAALKEFHDAPARTGKGGDFTDYSKPLLAFIAAHPESNWNAALHINLGYGYYRAGYYSRAFTEFEQAWRQGRTATTPQASIMIDRAVGELAKMHARVGHATELEAVLSDIGDRPVGGPATELLQGSRGALAMFKHNPDISYLCGPWALKNVLMTLKATPEQIKVADDARSGPHGFSLSQLAALANEAGLKFKLIHREPGQPVPVPSIINWNVHHYAAITREEDGRYVTADPTFGYNGGGAFTRKVIDAESSGYFLVPAQVAASNPESGWRTLSANSDEAKAVYGMGVAYSFWPGLVMNSDTCPTCGQAPGTAPPNTYPGSQMTVASATPQTVSLHLEDTPVGYKPQVGLPNFDKLSYNSREDIQPANFGFSNVSPKWSHGWMAYIQFEVDGNGYIERSAGGGGGYFSPEVYVVSKGQYFPESPDNSSIFKTPLTGTATSYVRKMPDGGNETYGLSNGAKTSPAVMFLTEVTDAQGNTTTLHYDASFRLTSVTDAMGRSTTYTYGLPGYPLLVTKITDPFGRAAQLTYDTHARLSSITDPEGITSSFTYSPSQTTFVTTLTTPYGTSTFNDTPNPNDFPEARTVSNSLTLTDPLGYTDYLYYYQASTAHPVTPDSDPAGTVPTGMGCCNRGIGNGLLSWRNTYYWNKHQFALGATMSRGVVTQENFADAALTHWYHMAQLNEYLDSSRQISSIKQPLENRVWFNQIGTYDGLWSGSLDLPTRIGRVLDDGTSQVTQVAYLQSTDSYIFTPLLTSQIDPLGRETEYSYATNDIDLL
jgi:YD repeat-containing protein